MEIEEIKKRLKKKACLYCSERIKNNNKNYESWIGKVCYEQKGEIYPVDELGNEMIPLITLFIDNENYIPESLKGIKLITIFVSVESLDHIDDENLDKWFCFRMYNNLENLVRCEYTSEEIKPCPLSVKYIDDDMPEKNDIEYIDEQLYDRIIELEDDEEIDYDNDIRNNSIMTHKIGGYPDSIQGDVGFDDGYEFVIEITSDENAEFNIIDFGNFYFGYNKNLDKWKVVCDFY